MFWVSAGMAMIISQIFTGGSLTPGLSWVQAVLASIAGSIVGFLVLSIVGIIAHKTGLPGLVLFRPSMGVRGAILASVFNNIQLLFWGAIHLFISGTAINGIVKMLTGYENPALWMAISAVIMIVASVYGNRAIKWLERISVPVLLLLMISIMFFAFKNYDLGTVINKPGEGASWIRGFDAMIASALTFAIMAGDFARYGIHSSDKKSNQYLKLALCLLSGSVLGTVVFHMIGITAFTATGVAMNPVDVMVELGLGYWGIIAVLLATITTEVMILYSIIMGTVNMFPKGLSVKNQRWSGVIQGVIMAIAAITIPTLLFNIQNALILMGVALNPLMGLIIADFFFVRKQRYTVERMYVGEQAYPVVNMVGIGSWVFGTIVYVLVMNYVPSIGAAWVSLVLTAAAYILLSRWFPAHIKLEEPKELENSQVETA
jgi:NCS1 nucleoside transporter family